MNKAELGRLTEQHLLLFGTIIQWFAKYELLMQDMMATAAGLDSANIMLLTRGLDFTGKRQALLDLLRHKVIPVDDLNRICEYLMVPNTLTPLRNDIAHSVWTSAPDSRSIQPAWILQLPPGVRPLREALFDANPDKFLENAQDKITYTLDELDEIVGRLAGNYRSFSDYVTTVGLITARPD
jgi:hypothetical protein